jgi:hypothetical protein
VAFEAKKGLVGKITAWWETKLASKQAFFPLFPPFPLKNIVLARRIVKMKI